MSSHRRIPSHHIPWLVALVALGACSGDSSSANDTVAAAETDIESQVPPSTTTSLDESNVLPVVVVTYSALRSIVGGIVGDAARIEVIIPNGTDPHDFEPSAKDVELMSSSAIVVANGLDLEEGLEDALAETEKSGVPVFHVADHVTLRTGEDEDHAHGAEDPHVWLDPLTLAEAVPAMAEQIGTAIDADLAEGSAAVVSSLQELDREIAAKVSGLESCVVITGHDSLGYFGERYGCEVLGSLIPSFSTAAEATAKNLAKLKGLATAEGVKAIFTELGTPADVAEQLAKEVGVEVVEIATHLVPDGGGYDEMMLALADAVVISLS
ncbi:MAG: metal ABC transporter substrate-binding protein [Actinomycetota bacterium]